MAYIRIPLKNILNINRIITLYAFDFSPTYFFAGESHDFWEIVYVDSGEVGLEGAGVLHTVKAGEMIFHKPNEFHGVKGDGIHSSTVFIITFECHSPAMKFFFGKVLSLPGELRAMMKTLIDECARNFHMSSRPLTQREHRPVGGLQLIRNYLECILIRLMREEETCTDGNGTEEPPSRFFRSRESLENNLVKDLNRYLGEHVYGRVTLEELCAQFHFGISTLCNIYKKNTGDTIMHAFIQLKIEEAKRLLREKACSVSEISESLGFDTPQYFSRMFHRYTGMSPRDYRNSLLSGGVRKIHLT